jgi:RimJ/RimL family protein N-acetyltransferase/GNAT superfamily N-acetyltransferase
MRVHAGGYEVDDDPARIDPDAAVAFLTEHVYWGGWRTAEDIKEQISQAWRVVGVYDRAGGMVGFARASGDAGSAYLADVYVLPEHRGAGLGKAIVALMVREGPGAEPRWMLHTSDAHGLYRQFGFAAPDGTYLERPRPAAQETAQETAGETAPADPLATGQLTGQRVRLEPLRHRHVPGLAAAASNSGDLYRWTPVPQGEAQMRGYTETAVAAADRGAAVPFAVIRVADDTVIGSSRFFDFGYWAWPDRAPDAPRTPDTCEIGYTWLSRDAIRTGANAEMKRLMLTYAFESWRVRSVCLHTDARNERSRAAMERMGARFEGILRAHRLSADLAPRDSARYSITAAEWPAVRQHLAELDRRY